MTEEQAEVKTEEVEVSTELKNIIEALIFASDEPMTVRFIRSIMDDVNKDLPPSEHFIVNAEIVRKAVGDLIVGMEEWEADFVLLKLPVDLFMQRRKNFHCGLGNWQKKERVAVCRRLR